MIRRADSISIQLRAEGMFSPARPRIFRLLTRLVVDELSHRLSQFSFCESRRFRSSFHFDDASSRRPSNLRAMTKVYANLPNVKVLPLHFAPEDISGERLLAMMKVDENTRK